MREWDGVGWGDDGEWGTDDWTWVVGDVLYVLSPLSSPSGKSANASRSGRLDPPPLGLDHHYPQPACSIPFRPRYAQSHSRSRLFVHCAGGDQHCCVGWGRGVGCGGVWKAGQVLEVSLRRRGVGSGS